MSYTTGQDDECPLPTMPCPRCGGGETRVDITRLNRGLSMARTAPPAIISVSIKHWCTNLIGQGKALQAYTEVRGRDYETAVKAWEARP